MSECIRFATPDDAGVLFELINELAKFEKLEKEVTGSVEKLRTSLTQKDCESIIAFRDDEPVGFALFFHNYSTFLCQRGLYLEDLYVREEARGGGVGKALLSYLAKVALERNCGRFEWSVLDWNTKAIEFYKSLEAKPMDGWGVFRLTGAALEQLGGS